MLSVFTRLEDGKSFSAELGAIFSFTTHILDIQKQNKKVTITPVFVHDVSAR